MKIFFTAGTQLAFARMSALVADVLSSRMDIEAVYQYGPVSIDISMLAGLSDRLQMFGMVRTQEFLAHIRWADLVVSHAGMGNVITCFDEKVPFLLMPRLESLGEHRNDHQLDTAVALQKTLGVRYFINTADFHTLAFEPSADDVASVIRKTETSRAIFAKNLRDYMGI